MYIYKYTYFHHLAPFAQIQQTIKKETRFYTKRSVSFDGYARSTLIYPKQSTTNHFYPLPSLVNIRKHTHTHNFKLTQSKEILKINTYKAPRDKLICILNCCKVIFGLIKHVEGDAGADKFLPILIYVVIRANPPRLVSNVQ